MYRNSTDTEKIVDLTYLKDGGKGRDADARADEDGVLGAEDVGGGGAEGAVHVHLQRLL